MTVMWNSCTVLLHVTGVRQLSLAAITFHRTPMKMSHIISQCTLPKCPKG